MNPLKLLLTGFTLVFLLSTVGAIANGNNYSNSACATLLCIAGLLLANLRSN